MTGKEYHIMPEDATVFASLCDDSHAYRPSLLRGRSDVPSIAWQGGAAALRYLGLSSIAPLQVTDA